jgi:hypothetical protein
MLEKLELSALCQQLQLKLTRPDVHPPYHPTRFPAPVFYENAGDAGSGKTEEPSKNHSFNLPHVSFHRKQKWEL